MRRAVFCLIGEFSDQVPRNSDLWERFRPTVAIGTQKNIEFTYMLIVYQSQRPDHVSLLKTLCDDIAQIRDESGSPSLKIIEVPVEFPDIHDFATTYTVVLKGLKEFLPEDCEEVYLHMNTGFHTMQFAMYTIAEQRLLPQPIFLVQTIPGEGERISNKESNTICSVARILDLSWVKYPEIKTDVEKRKYPFQTKWDATIPENQKLRILYENMMLIGGKTVDPLILLGPTGSGKTFIARIIHEQWCFIIRQANYDESNNAPPFMEFNCAGLSRELAYSQLFGHKKGAFTGAHADQSGLFEQADRGTLFLDEITELDLQTQAMLLKVIDDGKYFRLGDSRKIPLKANVRIICATNKNLEQMVHAGAFREDLYARLRAWVFRLPSIRERLEDIERLINEFLGTWRKEKAYEFRSKIDFEPLAKKRYIDFSCSEQALWIGNLRDLRLSIYRMATLASLRSDGSYSMINMDIVEEEIERLKDIWQRNFDDDIDDTNLYRTLTKRVKNQYPDKSIVIGTELFLRDICLGELRKMGWRGTLAEAYRRIYSTESCNIKNPTDQWKKRGNAISEPGNAV